VNNLNAKPDLELSFDIGSPKLRASERVGIHGWLHYFAAFSPSFVEATINMLKLSDSSLLLDPFLGSGTSCVVAKSMNIPSVGVELNPMAYFISRAKLCWNIRREQILSGIEELQNVPDRGIEPSVEYQRWFARGDATQERSLSIGSHILENFSGELRDFLMASLLLTLRKIATSKQELNPTWTPSRHKLPSLTRSQFHEMFGNQAKKMVNELNRFMLSHKSSDCCSEVFYADILQFDYPRQFDAMITSPPYLSRLDYVMSFRLENSLLEDLRALPGINIRNLRDRMIGTVTITNKSEPDPMWGETCLEVLREIRHHPSKAASSYYYPTVMKYFKDMFKFFLKAKTLLRQGCSAVIVIQTSYFKEIEIPVGRIFAEMARKVGFREAFIKRRENVRFHRGLLDPEQRRYAHNKVLHEDVLQIS